MTAVFSNRLLCVRRCCPRPRPRDLILPRTAISTSTLFIFTSSASSLPQNLSTITRYYHSTSFSSKSNHDSGSRANTNVSNASNANDNTDEMKIKVWEIPVGASAGAGGTSTSSSNEAKSLRKRTLYEYHLNDINSAKETTRSHTTKNMCSTTNEQQEWKKITYPYNNNNNNNNNKTDAANLKYKLYDNVIKHFLPNNYPNSVEKGYTQFISYCFLGNTFSSAAMVLSTQTLLLAVGVGSASASPMAGALNWVMKDGIGQLGGILFASRITSTTSSSSNHGYGGIHTTRTSTNTIDKDPKRWRMVSSLSMDMATFLEILTPLFPGYFLALASIANVGKNVGFLTASASRASIHQSLAKQNNLGDVTAKAGSQSIAASLIGTGLGIGLTPVLGGGGGDTFSIMIGFVCLSSMHQYCTYKSLQSVALKSLNQHRLHVIMNQYFIHSEEICKNDNEKEDENDKQRKLNELLSPESISKHEQFIPIRYPDDTHTWLHIGCSLVDITPNPNELHYITNTCLKSKEEYVINFETRGGGLEQQNMERIKITFHDDATDETMIRGLFHAYAMKHFMDCMHTESHPYFVLKDLSMDDASRNDFEGRMNIISKTHDYVETNFDAIYTSLKHSDWDLSGVHIEPWNSCRIIIE